MKLEEVGNSVDKLEIITTGENSDPFSFRRPLSKRGKFASQIRRESERNLFKIAQYSVNYMCLSHPSYHEPYLASYHFSASSLESID